MGASILTVEIVVSLFQVLSAKNRRDSVSLRKANDTGQIQLRRFEMNGNTMGSLTKT